MNKLIEQNLKDIEKITRSFYYRYKLDIYYEFEDVMQGAILKLLQTIKYFNPQKSPITRFIYIQISNHCKNLIADLKKDSKAINFEKIDRQFNIVGGEDNEKYYIDECIEDSCYMEENIISEQMNNYYINLFKGDDIKIKITFLLSQGYKRKDICKFLNINTRAYDWQLILIKREILKVV